MVVVMRSSTVKGAVKLRPNQTTRNCWHLFFCYVMLLYKWAYLLTHCHVHTCLSFVLTFMCIDFKWLTSICTCILLVLFIYILIRNFNYLFVTSFLFYLFFGFVSFFLPLFLPHYVVLVRSQACQWPRPLIPMGLALY